MRFASSLVCAALLVAAASCVSVHGVLPPAYGALSCGSSTCGGANATNPVPDECTATTLAAADIGQTCFEPFGAGLGYGKLYCNKASGQASLALFSQDSTCANASFTAVIHQASQVCAQSNVYICGGADSPMPDRLSAQAKYVSAKFCDTATCDDASCATTLSAISTCQSDYSDSSSQFAGCNAEASQFVESYYNQTNTCGGTAKAMYARPVGSCLAKPVDTGLPEYYGAYVQYGCGTAKLSSATVSGASLPLLAMAALAALVFARSL